MGAAFEFRPGQQLSDPPGGPCLIGQIVTLTVIGATSAQWQLPMSQICSGYEIGADGATFTPADPMLEVTLTPTFNFTVPGTYGIPVVAETPSGPVQTEFVIVVQTPSGAVNWAVPGAPGFYPDHPGAPEGSVGLINPGGPGIAFSVTITNPSMQYGMQFAFLQLCKPERTLRIDTGGIEPCPGNGRVLCDNYNGNPMYGGLIGNVPPGGSEALTIGDAPRVGTHTGLGQVDEIWIGNESFATYLMVLADDPGSIWAPIGLVTWSWGIHAVRGSAGWQTDGAVQPVPQQQPVGGFPGWTGRVVTPTNLEWGDWHLRR